MANKCINCDQALMKGAKFCGFCGTQQLTECPRCKTKDPKGPNFCISCGADLKTGRKARPRNVDSEIEDELKIYKANLQDGFKILTCHQCNTKNRVPQTKLDFGPTCGKCLGPLFP